MPAHAAGDATRAADAPLKRTGSHLLRVGPGRADVADAAAAIQRSSSDALLERLTREEEEGARKWAYDPATGGAVQVGRPLARPASFRASQR